MPTGVLPFATKKIDTTIGGLHIISNFESQEVYLLKEFFDFKSFINSTIDELRLNKVGEAYHNFEGGGFTAVVCLSESHLSIHTWPDKGYVTFDVFLSNFSTDNSPKAHHIYNATLKFFSGRVLFENTIER
jgi:S-adenosylmethionine decarboxylase